MTWRLVAQHVVADIKFDICNFVNVCHANVVTTFLLQSARSRLRVQSWLQTCINWFANNQQVHCQPLYP